MIYGWEIKYDVYECMHVAVHVHVHVHMYMHALLIYKANHGTGSEENIV